MLVKVVTTSIAESDREVPAPPSRQTIISQRPLVIGDKIWFKCNGRGRGGHYTVSALVDKINTKSVEATEAERSYRPGTKWKIDGGEFHFEELVIIPTGVKS